VAFCIIENDDGMTVVEIPPGQLPAEFAAQIGSTLIDPGPYDEYADAEDALEGLQDELAESDGGSDVPGTQALEGRETPE
jgi:hypothetical protein